MPPTEPHCWPLLSNSILFLSHHFIAIIRPDHRRFQYRYPFNWHLPGGIFICLLLLHFCSFYYTCNHVTRILFCRDQVLAGITFLHQNLSETYLLLKLYITSISPTILIFFGRPHEIEKGEKRVNPNKNSSRLEYGEFGREFGWRRRNASS